MRDGDTALLDEALEIWTRLGDEHGMGRALWGISEYYDYRGEAERGEEAATRALEIFERLGDPFWVSWSRFTRAFGRVMQGEIRLAAIDLVPTLREFWASRDLSGVTLVISATSTMLLMAGREVDGYRLAGAERRLVAETGLHLASARPDPRDARGRSGHDATRACGPRSRRVPPGPATRRSSTPSRSGNPWQRRRPRRPRRRRMADVHAPDRPAAASPFPPLRLIDERARRGRRARRSR